MVTQIGSRYRVSFIFVVVVLPVPLSPWSFYYTHHSLKRIWLGQPDIWVLCRCLVYLFVIWVRFRAVQVKRKRFAIPGRVAGRSCVRFGHFWLEFVTVSFLVCLLNVV